MKSYKLLLAALAFGSALMTTGCRDDFSEINQDPSAVTTGNVSCLLKPLIDSILKPIWSIFIMPQ